MAQDKQRRAAKGSLFMAGKQSPADTLVPSPALQQPVGAGRQEKGWNSPGSCAWTAAPQGTWVVKPGCASALLKQAQVCSSRDILGENGDVTVTLSNREGKMQRQINLGELELKELQ